MRARERRRAGRGIAGLLDDVSRSGVQKALVALVDAGLVLVERHPPANLYRLNRRHLAAAAITELATLRSRLITAIRDHLSTWDPAPWGAWLFGSAARSDGTASSDIDLLIVRPDNIDETNHAWSEQVDRLADDVSAWTGNPCAILEYGRTGPGERRLASVNHATPASRPHEPVGGSDSAAADAPGCGR